MVLLSLRKAVKDKGWEEAARIMEDEEIIEVEAGDGAVVVQISGELKIKSVKIDPEMIDIDDIEQLEHWIEIAVRDGLAKAQEVAAETMKPLMGGLGNLPL